MRNLREIKKLEINKKNSLKGKQEKFVLQNYNKREFFRYQDGELIEYDLTKFRGEKIEYSKEEKQSIRKLGFANL